MALKLRYEIPTFASAPHRGGDSLRQPARTSGSWQALFAEELRVTDGVAKSARHFWESSTQYVVSLNGTQDYDIRTATVTLRLYGTANKIGPTATNVDLGDNVLYWRAGYIDDVRLTTLTCRTGILLAIDSATAATEIQLNSNIVGIKPLVAGGAYLGTASKYFTASHVDNMFVLTKALPEANHGADLGTTAVRWNDLYIWNNLYANALTIHLATGSHLILDIPNTFSIKPATDKQVDLGVSGAGWRNAWIDVLTITQKLDLSSQRIAGWQTALTATAGAQTLPANPDGFVYISVGGVDKKVPYYAV